MFTSGSPQHRYYNKTPCRLSKHKKHICSVWSLATCGKLLQGPTLSMTPSAEALQIIQGQETTRREPFSRVHTCHPSPASTRAQTHERVQQWGHCQVISISRWIVLLPGEGRN